MAEDGELYAVEYVDGQEAEEGNFISRAGKARVTYANGDVYEGDFNEEKVKHGTGVYKYAAPAVEEGEEEDEPREPHTYEGEFLNGQRCGLGTMTYPDGGLYRGQWVNGERHGEGAMTYANKDIYSGQWRRDQRQGDGTYLFAGSDARLVGEWENGEMSMGKFVYADGTSFEGFFVQNAPSGEGVYRLSGSGLAHTGEYIERRVKVANAEDSSEMIWLGADVVEAEAIETVERFSDETKARKEAEAKAKMKFEEIDANGNGVLTAEELPALTDWVYTAFDGKMNKEKLAKKLLSRLDDNEDAVIDITEFTAWFKNISQDIAKYNARKSKMSSRTGKK